MFDLSLTKLLVLAVIALIVFGPHELPKLAQQAGRALRDLRRIAEGAKADLREGLGPEFQDFDFDDLNPRRFVQKHLLEEPTSATAPVRTPAANAVGANGAAVNGTAVNGAAVDEASGIADENPPFDFDAT